MFPGGPRRPMPPYLPTGFRQPQGRPVSSKSNLFAMFRNPEGKWDFDKVKETAQQMNQLYSQVSPLITRFIKK